MDKNTVIGLILMGLVVVLFTWLGRPSQEEIALQQRYNDSIVAVQQVEQERLVREQNQSETADTVSLDPSLTQVERDSLMALKSQQSFGEMAVAAQGTEQTYTLQNDSVVFEISSLGAKINSSKLLQYKDFLSQPIRLFRPEHAKMGFTFVTASNRVINTKDLYFSGEQLSPTSVRMTAKASNGGTLTFLYTLKNKYILDLQIIADQAFHAVLSPSSPYLDAEIQLPIYQNEKSAKTEQRYSGMMYQLSDGKVKKMNAAKNDKETLSGSIKWLGFRDMFFSTIIYAPKGLESPELSHAFNKDVEVGGVLKDMNAKFAISLDSDQPTNIKIFSGPNDYSLLNKLDKEFGDKTNFARLIDMGNWFRFINVWLIVPVFNFLERFFSSYGIIILLMTIIIKLIVSPFTYKSYESQAKMRVLKPQVDEINKKYEGSDKMMERQKATMDLYSKAGVNTMGGCLPMLLQMPFLVAMYQYFPTSINLRGESFLWAKDLSTYDDVVNWGFDIPFVGDHISLFCLLMTVTQVIYMNISQASSGQAQMPMMKWMPYIMSIFLFGFLNQNAAGLSYYYLLSMLISILQTQIFRWTMDEDKILRKLEENKKKPKKKSKFMGRLEEMQKQQLEMQKQQAKQQGRK